MVMQPKLAALALGILLLLAGPARATTIFSEDFDGYTSFPAEIPAGDPVNPGIPKISEGADYDWYAARFEQADSTCSVGLDCDVAVQKFGGGGNSTPVGRVEDDVGLLFRIDTTDLVDVVLSFDWRTFSASSGDQLVAGYYLGDIPAPLFGTTRSADLRFTAYSWANWVELERQNAHNTFTHQEFDLPEDAGIVWVALWLDDGEGDYAKFDNIQVSATANPIPEPSTLLLVLGGLAALSRAHRRPR
jgi:hypothetical protein